MPNFSLDCAYSKTFPGSILLPPPVSYAADELTSRECTVPGALNSVERMAMAEVLLLQFFFCLTEPHLRFLLSILREEVFALDMQNLFQKPKEMM